MKALRQISALCLLALISTLLCNCGCAGRKCAVKTALPPAEKFNSPTWELANGHQQKMYITKTSGKPILLLHALPGLAPGCLDLALDLEKEGFKVYMPLLFGKYGQNSGFGGYLRARSTGRWKFYNPTDAGLVQDDVNDLIRRVGRLHPRRPIAVIGNCLSGSLPLAGIANPKVNKVVICQPALPFNLPWKKAWHTELAIPEHDVAAALAALESNSEKKLAGFNYVNDKIAPSVRLLQLAQRAGSRKKIRSGQVMIVIAEKEPSTVSAFGSAGRFITQVKVEKDDGHSTIVAAPKDDREEFRKLLLEFLKKP